MKTRLIIAALALIYAFSRAAEYDMVESQNKPNPDATQTIRRQTASPANSVRIINNLRLPDTILILPSANLGTGGTGAGLKALFDDGTFKVIPGGGDALVANPLSQFASTTSAQLAGVITDENGSGKLLFAAGTIVIPTGDTLTVPAGGGTLGTNAFTSTAFLPASQVTGGGTIITGGNTLTIAATASVSGTNTGDQTNITGNAATVTTNANLTGPVTSTGNATAIANGAITNAMLANAAVANLSGTNTGDQTNISGNAATVTTNANLTGPVTSVGNATAIAAGAITNAMLANSTITINGGAISLGGSVSGLQTTAGTLALAGFSGITGTLANSNLANSSITIAGTSVSLGGSITAAALKAALSLTSADVGLANVTNDAQTKATIMPNSAPSSGQIAIGNGSGAYTPQTITGAVSINSTGATTLSSTGVSATTYTLATVTVGADGRITSASNGTAGTGDVTGGASSVDSRIVLFDGTTGKKIKDGLDWSAATAASSVGIRDSNANNFNNNSVAGYTATATAGTTTTLTAASTQIQDFTGSTLQTIVMPVTSTLTTGFQFIIKNHSTGTLIINSSGGNFIGNVVSGREVILRCILTTGTTAASWDMNLTGFDITGSIAAFLSDPSSSRLRTYMSDETGTGALYFQSGDVGTPTAGDVSGINQTTIATEQASTSGTSIDFTSIPSGVKRITVMFVGVSTNGTSNVIVQIGDSGGIETSGYSSAASFVTTGVGTTSSTAGFIVNPTNQAAGLLSGSVTLNLEDSSDNTWVSSGVLSRDTTGAAMSGGSKATSAVLDRVRITTTNGTDAFDAGVINISYTK